MRCGRTCQRLLTYDNQYIDWQRDSEFLDDGGNFFEEVRGLNRFDGSGPCHLVAD